MLVSYRISSLSERLRLSRLMFVVKLLPMSRQFKPLDYEATLDTSVRLGDCLPADHPARFVVDIVAQLYLKAVYVSYGKRGGAPYAP